MYVTEKQIVIHINLLQLRRGIVQESVIIPRAAVIEHQIQVHIRTTAQDQIPAIQADQHQAIHHAVHHRAGILQLLALKAAVVVVHIQEVQAVVTEEDKKILK